MGAAAERPDDTGRQTRQAECVAPSERQFRERVAVQRIRDGVRRRFEQRRGAHHSDRFAHRADLERDPQVRGSGRLNDDVGDRRRAESLKGHGDFVGPEVQIGERERSRSVRRDTLLSTGELVFQLHLRAGHDEAGAVGDRAGDRAGDADLGGSCGRAEEEAAAGEKHGDRPGFHVRAPGWACST